MQSTHDALHRNIFYNNYIDLARAKSEAQLINL